MMTKKKIARTLLSVAIFLLVTFAISVLIEERYYSLYGGNVYEDEIVDNVQKVADSTTYFIEVFPFDSIEYHEIPVSFIYQDGRLRKYVSYKDTNYYFLQDAKGYFSINTADTSVIKPYKRAYEIDVFSLRSDATIDGRPICYLDGLLWNYFTFMTDGVGYIQIFDLNNTISDSIIYQRDRSIIKSKYQNLFAEYKIRPYRIFYTNDNPKKNIKEDVAQTFDELVCLFQTQKCVLTTSLSYSTFLPDSEMVKNEYYTISQDRPYIFGSHSCELSIASYANKTAYNKIIEKEHSKAMQELMSMLILSDSAGSGRCKFEHSIFQTIDYPLRSQYLAWGKSIKEKPENEFYQYITIHKDNYDVMYVLSDEHFYHLDCWNEENLRKKGKFFDYCATISFIGGLILLIVSLCQFLIARTERKNNNVQQ